MSYTINLREPVTEAEHAAEDHRHRELAVRQRRYSETVANKIQRGEPLTSMESKWAAEMIRRGAASIPLQRTRPAGRPDKLPPDDCRLNYAVMTVHEGMTDAGARRDLQAKYRVSAAAIKKRLGKAGPEPERTIAREATEAAVAFVSGWKTET